MMIIKSRDLFILEHICLLFAKANYDIFAVKLILLAYQQFDEGKFRACVCPKKRLAALKASAKLWRINKPKPHKQKPFILLRNLIEN